MDYEQIIMNIIVNGGDARSFALKALRSAKKGNYTEAEELMTKANTCINAAHEIQTKLIQQEVRGEGNDVSLLMVHAQDHLMDAMTIYDLVFEFIGDDIKVREEVNGHD